MFLLKCLSLIPSLFFLSKSTSCLTPKPCSGNCPSPLSWLAFAHYTDTLVLAGICRWGRRAVSYTLMHPSICGHTHTWVHAGAHERAFLSLWFLCLCVCVCVSVSMRGRVFFSPRQQCREVSEPTVRALSRPPEPRNTDLYVSSEKWNHPFLCQPLCVCVCVCEWQKQWGDKRTRPCFELCHFVISHCFMLSIYALRLSSCHLCLSLQFTLYLFLWFPLSDCLLSLSINSRVLPLQEGLLAGLNNRPNGTFDIL